MNHRRAFLRAATPLACSLILLPIAGCGESGGVSAVPVKGTPSAGGSPTQPMVPPSSAPAPEAPSGPAKAGTKQAKPLDIEE